MNKYSNGDFEGSQLKLSHRLFTHYQNLKYGCAAFGAKPADGLEVSHENLHVDNQIKWPREWICLEANVGTSTTKTKTITLPAARKCPVAVDKTNWIGDRQESDQFSIAQMGTQITVTRTEGDAWGLDLKFKCCGEIRSCS